MSDEIKASSETPGGGHSSKSQSESIGSTGFDGITIQNNTGHDCLVAVSNGALGLRDVGYVPNGKHGKFGASLAWWDVHALRLNPKDGAEAFCWWDTNTSQWVFSDNCLVKTHVGNNDTIFFDESP